MSNKFTYIIRSPLEGNNNDIYMRLNGLPTQYRYFNVKVQGFYVPQLAFQDLVNQNGQFVELKCYNLNIINGKDGSKNMNTVAITTTNNDYSSEPFQFQCENFNNQLLNFQLVNEFNDLYNIAGYAVVNWILILNMEGIEDTV